MKYILITIFTLGLLAPAISKASECPGAWTNEDKAYLQQLYHDGLRTEITAFKRYHRAKMNSCNGDFSANFVMRVHYNTDKDIQSERDYNESQHVAGSRY